MSDYVEFIAKLKQGNPSPGGLPLLRQSLGGVSKVPENATILEIGSNTGSSLAAIAEYFPSASVTGIDISESMVKECESYLAELRSEGRIGNNVEVKKEDACALPFKNQSVDLVISGGTLSFVEDREKAISEIERVLKPGGTFLSLEYGYFDSLPPKSVSDEVSKILEFDVTKTTMNYWYGLHTTESMAIEGMYLHEPLIHRAKDIGEMQASIRRNLANRKSSYDQRAEEAFTQYIEAFAENEKFTKITAIFSRKYEGTKLLMDHAN